MTHYHETREARTRMDSDKIPPILIKAMFGLVAVCLVMVSAYVWTGRPVIATPPEAAVAASRVLYLDGDMSGAARVRDAEGTVIAEFPPETGGFVSGISRVLARERTKHRVALDGPVTLVRGTNGRLTLYDDTTGWRADLMGFGLDNARTFARLLD